MSATLPPIPAKPTYLEEMLAEFAVVAVSFVPGRGALMPGHLAQNKVITLHYGLNMPVPIPDLVLAKDGIVATMSFNRTPFRTFVPWGAIFLIEDAQGTVGHRWDEDLPRKEEVSTVATAVGAPSGAPKLSLVPCNDQVSLSPPRASLWVMGATCEHDRSGEIAIDGSMLSQDFLPCAVPGCRCAPQPEPQYPGLLVFGQALRRKWTGEGWIWEAHPL